MGIISSAKYFFTPRSVKLKQQQPTTTTKIDIKKDIEEGQTGPIIPTRVTSGGGGGGSSTTTTTLPPSEQSKIEYSQRLSELRSEVQAGTTKPKEAQSQLKQTVKELNLKLQPAIERQPSGVISAVEKPKGRLERAEYYLKEKAAPLQTKQLRGGLGFGESVSLAALGFGRTIVGAGIGTKEIITHPVKTAKEVPTLPSRLKLGAEQFGETLRTSPSEATGIAAGQALLIKSPSLVRGVVVKGVDIGRTARLTELPAKKVIAPEYYQGQTFPKISKGQTAGQLKSEFVPLLTKETKPAGFTAAPKPFAKETITGRGTSELPGVYQAPKVSPYFLKVSGEEKKLFTLKPFGTTLRPSITRITPQSYELVPGLKPSQKAIQSQKVGEIKTFFETAPKGKSYIPFVKTEKEAVIPFGTPVKQVRKESFIKFEGRRIPISEFETKPTGILETKPSVKFKTAGQVSKSSRRIGQSAYYSPSSALGLSSFASLLKPSKRGVVSYREKDLVSRQPFISKREYPRVGLRGYPSRETIYKSSRYPTSYPPYSPGISGFPLIYPPKTPREEFYLGIKTPKVKTKGKYRIGTPFRTPSLYAIGYGIKAPKKAKGEEFGAGSLVVRPIIKRRKNAKKRS